MNEREATVISKEKEHRHNDDYRKGKNEDETMVDGKCSLQRFRNVLDADGVRQTMRRSAEERTGRCQTSAE